MNFQWAFVAANLSKLNMYLTIKVNMQCFFFGVFDFDSRLQAQQDKNHITDDCCWPRICQADGGAAGPGGQNTPHRLQRLVFRAECNTNTLVFL